MSSAYIAYIQKLPGLPTCNRVTLFSPLLQSKGANPICTKDLQEGSSDELRKFIDVDDKDAVEVGELAPFSVVKKAVRPVFDKETFTDARTRP